MSDFETKRFLDFDNLKTYDELIKKYIGEVGSDATYLVNVEKDRAIQAEKDIIDALADLANGAVADNAAAIAVLNGDSEGSVKKAVDDAVAGLLDGAPEIFDTLKELADWINDSESGFDAANRIVKLENRADETDEELADLKEYVDTQDVAVYTSIQAIENLKIVSLFPIVQGESESAVEAIDALTDGGALKLTADQTIAEDVTIDKSCFIDANGATFEGTVTVPAGKDVVIENATFAKPVVVA